MSKIVYFFALVMALVLAFAMAQEEVTTYNLKAVSKKAIDIAPLFEVGKECADVFVDNKYVPYYVEDATGFNAVVIADDTNTDVEKFVESDCGKALVALDADIVFTASTEAKCLTACGPAECLCLEGDACDVPTGDDDVNPCGGDKIVCKDAKCVKDDEEEPEGDKIKGQEITFKFSRAPVDDPTKDAQLLIVLAKVAGCFLGSTDTCKDKMDGCSFPLDFEKTLRSGKEEFQVISFTSKCTQDQLDLIKQATTEELTPETFNLLQDDDDFIDKKITVKSISVKEIELPETCTDGSALVKCVADDKACVYPCGLDDSCEDNDGCQYGLDCAAVDETEDAKKVCVSSASIAQITLAVVLTIAAFIF